MPPFVADLSAVADDPLAFSAARIVAALARQQWHIEGPAAVKLSTLAKRLGSIEPGAIESVEASGFATRVRDGADPWIRPTGLALAVGGFIGTAIDLPATDRDGDPAPILLVDLARTGLPSVPAEALAFHLGREVGELWADLGTLAVADLVALWPDHPAGPAASLTPHSAERMGLRLASDGSRWLRAGDPDPADIRRAVPDDEDDEVDPIALAVDRREVGGLDGLILAETVAGARRERFDAIADWMDPERDRERLTEQRRESMARTVERRRLVEATRRLPAAERKARLADLDARHQAERWAKIHERMAEQPEVVSLQPPPPPPFRVFLGMRSTWPIPVGPRGAWHPWQPSDGLCPECGNRPLSRLTVCLHCHRSGLDDLLNPPRRAPKRSVLTPGQAQGKAQSRPTAGLKGGIG